MTEGEEQSYLMGKRSATVAQLYRCLDDLGYDNPHAKTAGWVAEREAAVALLRYLCLEHGDNDWPDDLHLSEVIEKHLMRHIERRL